MLVITTYSCPIAAAVNENSDSKSVEAMVRVGDLLMEIGWQQDDVNRNWQESVEYFTRAAEAGSVEAKYCLGEAWMARSLQKNAATSTRTEHGGTSVAADVDPAINEAVKWFTAAADGGHSMARHSLAAMHEHGHGVTHSISLSIYYYRLAVLDCENVDALHALGWLLLRQGDNLDAKKCFDRAMQQSHVESAYVLDNWSEILFIVSCTSASTFRGSAASSTADLPDRTADHASHNDDGHGGSNTADGQHDRTGHVAVAQQQQQQQQQKQLATAMESLSSMDSTLVAKVLPRCGFETVSELDHTSHQLEVVEGQLVAKQHEYRELCESLKERRAILEPLEARSSHWVLLSSRVPQQAILARHAQNRSICIALDWCALNGSLSASFSFHFP